MYLSIFDALLMFVTMVILNVVHPYGVGRLRRCHIDHDLTRFPDEQTAKLYEVYPGA
jgi:hypothetical protein